MSGLPIAINAGDISLQTLKIKRCGPISGA
jgi:hypothetical protein